MSVRAVVYVVLLGLAIAAALSGRLDVALALGGLKALLVGVEYMELRHADRRHALAFAAVVVALVVVMAVLGAGAG